MRTLLEEYGNVIIAVGATLIMIVFIMLGGVFPIMNEYTMAHIPEDTVKNEGSKNALEACLEREEPTITADDTITLKRGGSVNLKEKISATNADGNNISSGIVFKFSSEGLKDRFNNNTGIFNGNGLSAGRYEVVVLAFDKAFGKTAEKTITIIVQ